MNVSPTQRSAGRTSNNQPGYRVRRGDSLSAIAQQHGVALAALKKSAAENLPGSLASKIGSSIVLRSSLAVSNNA